jgi:hypothetical protein
MNLDLTTAIETHHPVKGGSSMSNLPGGYTGDWVICSCDPADAWDRMAQRIPIADYPAHLLAAAAPLIAAQVGEQIAAAIEAERKRPDTFSGWSAARRLGLTEAARIAREGVR